MIGRLVSECGATCAQHVHVHLPLAGITHLGCCGSLLHLAAASSAPGRLQAIACRANVVAASFVQGPVLALAAAGGMLFSGGQDGSIRAWRLNQTSNTFELGVRLAVLLMCLPLVCHPFFHMSMLGAACSLTGMCADSACRSYLVWLCHLQTYNNHGDDVLTVYWTGGDHSTAGRAFCGSHNACTRKSVPLLCGLPWQHQGGTLPILNGAG